MNGIIVEHWVYNKNVDYDEFNKEPTYEVMDIKASHILHKDEPHHHYLYLR